jgi:hypothetical protein
MIPRKGDALLVHLFWNAGYRGQQLQALNQCRMALKLLYLSHISTACGRSLEASLLLKPSQQNKSLSKFVFPNEQPARSDWNLWLDFWRAFSGPGWALYIPLGAWENPTHRRWEWFYDPQDNLIIHMESNKDIIAYSITGEGHRLQSRQVYPRSHALGQVPSHCFPADVLVLPGDHILRRGAGPPLVEAHSKCRSY